MMISVEEMWTRWALSEARSTRFGHWCPNPKIEQLQKRIEAEGLCYPNLSATDRKTLLTWIQQTRMPGLSPYVEGVDYFKAAYLERSEVEVLFCPFVMNNCWVKVRDYVSLTGDPPDARTAALTIGREFASPEPVIDGRWGDHDILIDGFFRAACFLKFGSGPGPLPAYIAVKPEPS